ncbi:Virus X resistance protein-like, coiled-coil domain [Sesbania bispinosa]|nr:Virus X resistance protein-like, coiled-coil domain [Sesbania bispinosa]
MAESAVAFLLQNLSQLLKNEAKLLFGVEDKIKLLHNELQMINVYLKSSSEQKNMKEIQQTVVSQIRDVAYEAEDVIDTFITNVSIYNRRSKVGRMLHSVEHAKMLHNLAEKIDSIKTAINEIHKQDQIPRKIRRNVEEEDVVGFVHDSKLVINMLNEGGSRRKVVSIIGMGGLGKTTLARMVYNSNEVKKYFNFRAWVYVSNECRSKDLLLALVKHLMPNAEYKFRRSNRKGKKNKETNTPRDLSSLTEDELKTKVQECLKDKKYLLVLDDLWKKEDWDEVQDAFPDGNTGNRILITSRLKEVASHASQDPPYCLKFLGEKESWELFSKKVFKGEDCPSSDLESLGKQIVKSCRGLPLSIVVLAGILANKEKTHREWSKVVGHVNWYLSRDETQVKDIVLKLSYDNLPTRLKPCFLYLGSRDPDDVAEDYLYELIDRSLIQVAQRKASRGVKTCRIHDLLRDLCVSKGKEDKGEVPKRLLCLQQLSHLKKLTIAFGVEEWKTGSEPEEVLQSLEHLNHLSVLKIHHICVLPTCVSSFPPNITKLALRDIRCLNDDGMNALGNLTKLRILNLSGIYESSSFDLNCIAGEFPQLQVFQMRNLKVQNWKLANGAIPCLESVVIDKCRKLESLPDELWSLTTLRKVQVNDPSEFMTQMLRNLEPKDGCELIVG